MRLPAGGIPGVDQDAIIELVKPVYGLADAPNCWYKSIRAFLLSCGLKQSSFDPCIFMKHDVHGILQGVLAIHVDDLAMGGNKNFHDSVLVPLREKYPFKHWHLGGGDFLGKKVEQRKDMSIVISQREYSQAVACIKISKERRKQKDDLVNENEKSQMRALLGIASVRGTR